ncbi:MAG TPA: ATP-binding protein [Candidatus Saccharimonadales bacterium]|nr:ATP-binding protein [Candidatus Saccharimonadales bacterium]
MQSKIQVKKPFILILYGYPGSGKSTFARQFAKEINNTIHIHSDKIRTELGGKLKRKGIDTPEVYEALVEYMTKEFLASGFNVLLDVSVPRRSDRRKIRNLAYANNAKLVMAWLQIDADTAFDRLRKRDKRKVNDRYAKSYTRAEFESVVNNSQNPDDEEYVVISGKHTFSTQKNAVFKKLEELKVLTHSQIIVRKIRPELVNLIPQSMRGREDIKRRDISIR